MPLESFTVSKGRAMACEFETKAGTYTCGVLSNKVNRNEEPLLDDRIQPIKDIDSVWFSEKSRIAMDGPGSHWAGDLIDPKLIKNPLRDIATTITAGADVKCTASNKVMHGRTLECDPV